MRLVTSPILSNEDTDAIINSKDNGGEAFKRLEAALLENVSALESEMKADVSNAFSWMIYDGIIDVKAYTFDGDVCVEVERVYTFPTQMSALRHYRRAVERAELYNDIQLHKNQIKYDLKDEQHKLETKGMTKEQLKAKFEKQIADCKADAQRHHDHHRK